MACYAKNADADVLVVGGGGAGVRAAIEAATKGLNVILCNKGIVARSGLTTMAAGGVAAVMGTNPHDSARSHFLDTVVMGHYLADQNLVELLVENAPLRVKELEKLSVKGPVCPYHHKGGHSHERGVFIKGYTIMKALKRWAGRIPRIKMLEDCMATKLFTCGGQAAGAFAIDIRKGEPLILRAKATIIATGGLGGLFSHSTNSPHGLAGDSSGIGAAMAYHAGARFIDMEMMQFYPIVCLHPKLSKGLVFPFEIVRGILGAKICNAKGETFLEDIFEKGGLLRDLTTKLEYEEILAGRGTEHGGLYWDLARSDVSPAEFDRIAGGGEYKGLVFTYNHLKRLGWDITKRLEFKPGAHFICGGVHINERGETTVPGLFAAGEVAGNTHGANRLVGNAIADVLVFGELAGRFASDYAMKSDYPKIDEGEIERENDRIFSFLGIKSDTAPPTATAKKLREIMDGAMGPLRNGSDLAEALTHIRAFRDYELPRIGAAGGARFNLEWLKCIELPFMLDVAEIMVLSAQYREESRGAHQRKDFPGKDDDKWLVHTAVVRENGGPKIFKEPTIFKRFRPPKTDLMKDEKDQTQHLQV